MKRLTLGVAAAAAGLAGCATDSYAPEPATAPISAGASATAQLRDSAGRPKGVATARQVGDSLQVRIEAINLPSGAHGAHIHAAGLCAAPGFESAGPHWNPTGRQHGRNNPAGMHHGDLPNLIIGADGRATLEYTVAGASLAGGGAGMLDADGAAIVIHAAADDDRTDPSGNSGARIACGVFS